MPTPGYAWYVGNLRTGQIIRKVDLVGYSWTRYVDGPETLEGSFPLRSVDEVGNRLWRDAASDIANGQAFLAVAYQSSAGTEYFLGGGPIRPHNVDGAGVLQLGASGLFTYYSRRKVIPAEVFDGVPVSESKVTYTGNQLGLIAKRLIENVDAWSGPTADYSPPVALPDDADLGGAGTFHERTYPGYELAWVADRIKNLTDDIDGPEIQFVPRRRDDDQRFIEWVMRIGVAADDFALVQSGNPWVFDYTVPQSSVASLTVNTDASNVTRLSWAAGQGEAEARPIDNFFGDWTEITAGEHVLHESEVQSNDTVDKIDAITAKAEADSYRNAVQVETWTLRLYRDGEPHVGLLSPGDWSVVRVKDHETIPDGNHLLRIASIAGDTSKFVTVTMQPNQSEVA